VAQAARAAGSRERLIEVPADGTSCLCELQAKRVHGITPHKAFEI
jgi:hypothetical protein